MKTEITLSNNFHKIERVILDTQNQEHPTLTLGTKNRAEAESLGRILLSKRDSYVSTDQYELDCFKAKLTDNQLTLTGDMRIAVKLLSDDNFIDKNTVAKLEQQVNTLPRPMTPPRTDFFAERPNSPSPQSSSTEEELSPTLSRMGQEQEHKVESEVTALFQSFSPEDREKVLRFSELLEKLGANKENVLQKLSSGGRNTPGMNKA